jgi:uncharacterized protein YkwD
MYALPLLFLAALQMQMINEINLVRTDPKGYAKLLTNRLRYYEGNLLELPGQIPIRTQEGVRALEETIQALKIARPVPALKLSEGLSRAAADHVKDQGRHGLFGHQGTDGSTPASRAGRYSSGPAQVGENVSYGAWIPRDVVIDLLVDDGVPSRGHRRNMLNPAYQHAGAACGNHSKFGTMCVIDFAITYRERQ